MSAKESSNIGKVLSFLREWDRSNSAARSRILHTFLRQNAGKTLYELELEFAQVASLFLARLTTWMKLTYMIGTFLGIQLKAIGIFLSASNHDQYLTEFLDDGGVLTLLEILSHSRSKEDEKAEALRLLINISNAGRSYKEFICESHGVKVIAECLAVSKTDDTQMLAGALLKSLSHGNLKYQEQIYKCLIDLMTCTSPNVQKIVLQTLHNVQLKLKTAHHTIVAPLLNMLRSLHIEVQDEAINLILELKHYDMKGLLLSGLVALLGPNAEGVKQQQATEAEGMKMTGLLSDFVQQAAAAKTIRLLSEQDLELSRELLSLGVIQQLLYAMGNREHPDVRVQASLSLQHFVSLFPGIEEHVERVMGSTMFAAFNNRADFFNMNIDERQTEALLSNQVSVSQVLKSIKSDF